VPELDIREIATLEKLENSLFCMRLCLEDDQICTTHVEKDAHPSEFTVPLYHLTKAKEKQVISIEDAIKANKVNPNNKDEIRIKLPKMED
jgi:hypothetical protein